MEVLVLDGKNYVKASKAAKELGYATDYVGQLCRTGQVDAHLIGRTWYVNQDQLGTHRVDKKRMSRVKAREQAKQTIEKFRQKKSEPQNTYKNIAIQYESDSSELIPATKKLSITSERYVTESHEDQSETIVENKGEKIVMSGELNVVDVTDGPIETDTITLKPSRFKKGIEMHEQHLPEDDAEHDPAKILQVTDASQEERVSFKERLEAAEVVIEESDEASVTEEEFVPETVMRTRPAQETKNTSSVWLWILLLCMLVITIATIPTTAIFTYSADAPERLQTTYEFSIEDAITIIQSKI